MRRRNGSFLPAAALAALAFCLAVLPGCARMQQREWGGCAAVGAVFGAGVGAASGIVIADKVHGHGSASNDAKVGAGLGGAAIGAGLGALAGHFLCDPLAPPPPPPPPPVAQAAPPPPPPPPPPPQEKLVLRGVHFDFNKSDIRPEDEPVLDEAAETLKSKPEANIYVDGYCDAIGSDEYNQALSERRSAAVAKYLEGKGIAESRLTPRGFGKTNFVAPNTNPDGSDNPDGRAQNRRVELAPTS